MTWPATRSATAVQVEVRRDAGLIAARDAALIDGVRDHDPFARHTALTWPRPAVRAALAQDLAGDDTVAADRAADGLWGDADPTPADVPLVARALLRHLQPPDGGSDLGLMTRLLRFYQAAKPRELDDAVDRLCEARTDGVMRRLAIDRARGVPQLDTTRLPAREPWQVNLGLVPPRPPVEDADAVRIGAAIELSKDLDSVERRIGLRSLARFPGDPDAAAAIRARLSDPDPECRSLARDAADRIPNSSATRPRPSGEDHR